MHPAPHQTGTYRPRLSWAVALFGIAALTLLLSGIVVVLWAGLPLLQAAVSLLVLLAMSLYVIDAVFFTRYVLTERALVVSGQLRHLTIPYADIRKVRHGGLVALVSRVTHKRHALSPDCLVVEIRQGPYRTVSLSPADERQFLGALMHNLEATEKRTVGGHAG